MSFHFISTKLNEMMGAKRALIDLSNKYHLKTARVEFNKTEREKY
jgi:hypothetical protein